MRAAVIACALASAGCELVFPAQGGGDDGDDVAPGPDAASSMCTQLGDVQVVLCADFDTVDTGLFPGRLEPIMSTGGFVGIQADPLGPSPPSALYAAQAMLDGTMTSWAQASHVRDAQWRGAIEVAARATQPLFPGCEPVVLDVALTTAAVKVQAVVGGFRIVVVDNGTEVEASSIVTADMTEWNGLRLVLDVPMGLVALSVNQGVEATVSPQIVLVNQSSAVATVMVGMASLQPHGACGYLFDSLVVRTFPTATP